MSTELEGAWPYFREQPDRVVLGAAPGAAPSSKPPVRIFLGTEEGQYRAERVFVWSILKHRDPSRVYEVHLMKNVAGFDRRGWRTGFTCYRFAIPDFAGRQGKAIYNDVDQIYLADPARLFDLDLGGHGYLAIDARDTSVMLIDCEKMLPWWNRAAASRKGAKGPLTSAPAKTLGLWGKLDGHWNARDLEYVEGRTMCLHYTALHQQPWNPFPDVYSYHENPLAYLWHDLEREADAAGYEVFTREVPSPGFAAVVGGNAPPPPSTGGALVSPGARQLLGDLAAQSLVVAQLDPSPADGLAGLSATVGHHPFGRDAALAPDSADVVLAAGIFERLPGGDIGWVLGELFAAARRAVILRIAPQSAEGVGSTDWWRRRIALTAQRFPAITWQLDAVSRLATGSFGVATSRVRHLPAPSQPLVWALLGEGPELDRQVRRVGLALGWPVTEKRLAYGPLAVLPNATAGASLARLDRAGSDELAPPWPDVVIASGRRSAPVARWIKERSQGRARVVQLGRPGGSFALYDLIVAAPDDRLPIRANVLQVAAPLGEAAAAAGGPSPGAVADPRLAALKRPLTLLLLTGSIAPFVLDETAAGELGRAAAAEVAARGGSLVVAADASVPPAVAAVVRAAAAGVTVELLTLGDDAEDSAQALLAAADAVIVTAGNARGLAEACLAGKPTGLFELRRWHDDLPVLQPILRAILPLVGGKTYRGTPLQQHFPGRIVDWLTTQGLLYRPRDVDALYRSLEARGLVTRLGAAERVATPKPLDDLARVADRVRRLLSEVSQAA